MTVSLPRFCMCHIFVKIVGKCRLSKSVPNFLMLSERIYSGKGSIEKLFRLMISNMGTAGTAICTSFLFSILY